MTLMDIKMTHTSHYTAASCREVTICDYKTHPYNHMYLNEEGFFL